MPPKAARGRKRAASPEPTKPDLPEPSTKRQRTTSKQKESKASHLYTDDNPETTLHGTGFKDAATAHHTVDLVSKRSLTYQFQTINTMLFRAKGHKHKTPGIEAAIDIFQDWVSKYKVRKAELRAFPLLSKPKVKSYLEAFDAREYDVKSDEELKDAEAFARMYTELGARKRLANTLVDIKHPELEDWDIRRYNRLCKLVPEDKEFHMDELWTVGAEPEHKPSQTHLTLILWGFSPSKKV